MDKQTEQKWMDRWEKEGVFKAEDFSKKPKFYGLIEFPYPSAYGFHIGHMRAYTSMEIIARMKRLQGYNVLFPIGYDAFGLPSENYAIKTGIAPQVTNKINIDHMRSQLKSVGFSFDYDREVDTTDPNYYKWTQWIFLQLFKKGLAYRDIAKVNYCEKCKCILSNEESQGGKCDRCGSQVVQKDKQVWFLKITDYAEDLLKGIDELECNDAIKDQMRNWIGKSTGAEINFESNFGEKICVYTTRPDTIFGVTFLVLSPEHKFLQTYKDKIKNIKEVEAYQAECRKKTEFERLFMNKDKTGVKLDGLVAYNPITKAEVPIFIADYVLSGYGTGAIMAVPAHDERDFDFAKKFGIKVIEVIAGGDVSKAAYTDIAEGKLVNSEFLNGLSVKEAKEKIIDYLDKNGLGKKKTNYNMKDWAFNRQRYWGEPIPIVYCEKCGMVPVPEEELPLVLPMLKEFKPGENGESPLLRVEEFVNCKCPHCGGPARRETDTMPQWAGSSWYFLRYMDPHNDHEFANMEKLKYWGKVDWYNGGMEHVTRHLLYSRFWNEFLFDQGLVPNKEPYKKRTAVGLVLGEDGQKMSKSLGNVVDPDELLKEYGADVVRLYTMFIGDYEKAALWSSKNIVGCKRFLEKVEKICSYACDKEFDGESALINKTIKKVTEDSLAMKFNTAIASMFEFVNAISNKMSIKKENLHKFLTLLYPYAPFSAEEFNEKYLGGSMIAKGVWPEIDESKVKEESVEIPVQFNGRVRGTIKILKSDEENAVVEKLKDQEFFISNTAGKEIVKTIFVKGKIINFILK